MAPHNKQNLASNSPCCLSRCHLVLRRSRSSSLVSCLLLTWTVHAYICPRLKEMSYDFRPPLIRENSRLTYLTPELGPSQARASSESHKQMPVWRASRPSPRRRP